MFPVFVPPECGVVKGVDALADEIGVPGGELAGVEACDDAEERQIALDVFAPFVLAQAPAKDIVKLGLRLGQLDVGHEMRLRLLMEQPVIAMSRNMP